jgi:hypothetical protein
MNYFTPIFAIIIGILCLWMSIRLIRLYLKVKKWDRVPAEIKIKEMFLHPKYSTTRSPYGLKVEYNYKVNDHLYSGNKVYLAELIKGQANHTKALAEKKLQQLEDEPMIFVDPQNPENSVIYCEGIGLYVFIFLMGMFAFLFALGSLLA